MRLISSVLAVAVGAVVLTLGPPAAAVDRPETQLPFGCGKQVRMETGPTHNRARAKLLDMYNPPAQGEPVLASHDGQVIRSMNDGGLGHLVVVKHSSGYYTAYAHLLDRAVSVGQTVRRGDQVGRLGASGSGSGGVPHLHYEQHFDYDGDGWDYTNEWVYPVFDGVEYRLSEGGNPHSMTLTSKNCPSVVQQRTRFADIDGDGRDEIISILGSGEVWAYRNRGWGTGDVYLGADSKLIARGFTNPTSTFFADIDGDGRDEIIAIVGPNSEVWAYRNRGNWAGGDLYAGNDSKLVAQGFTGERTVFGDLTGDGRDEIATVHLNGDVVAYRNRGNWAGGDLYAGWDVKTVARGFDPQRTRFAEMDGDGFEELITVLHSGAVYAYRNLGQWENGETYTGGNNRLVASGFTDTTRTKFGDLTGDGRAEIATVLGSGHVWAYRNRGNWAGGDLYQGSDSRKVAEGFGP